MDLRTYLFFQRKTVTDFAKELGISRRYLGNIMGGLYIPSRKLALRIEELTGGEVKAETLRPIESSHKP